MRESGEPLMCQSHQYVIKLIKHSVYRVSSKKNLQDFELITFYLIQLETHRSVLSRPWFLPFILFQTTCYLDMFQSQPCTCNVISNFYSGCSWLKVMEDNLRCIFFDNPVYIKIYWFLILGEPDSLKCLTDTRFEKIL